MTPYNIFNGASQDFTRNYSFSDICHLGKLLLMGGSSQSRLGTFLQHFTRVLIVSEFIDKYQHVYRSNLENEKLKICKNLALFIAYLPHVRSTYAIATTIIAVMHYLLSYLQYDRY